MGIQFSRVNTVGINAIKFLQSKMQLTDLVRKLVVKIVHLVLFFLDNDEIYLEL